MLDLLLVDPSNPRSLAFALAALRDHLAAMPASTGSTRAERLLDHLETELAAADIGALGAVSDGRRDALVVFLGGVTAQLEQLSVTVHRTCTSRAGRPPSRCRSCRSSS
ncbi:alpha-E domain-containing protein [Microbacterium aurum]